MGPRLQVETSEFRRLIQQEPGLVIQNRRSLLGTTYLSQCGD